MEQKIKMIALENIHPHPDNPRKDLGDLTELADSIEKNGIMQNLTVMPGHYDGTEWKETGYTLLIGHRRAAAAKLARIAVVPCTVVKIPDRKEQISIMLEENMQRTDLTIREQAQGFQMMLDLGDTVETVAKKTGFSTATIKHRIEIAKLDPKAIAAAETDGFYQISIGDYMKLEKLPTVEMRNEVLRNARDGRQLDFKIKDMLQKIQDEEAAKKITEKLKERGVKKGGKDVNRWSNGWSEEQQVALEGAGNIKKIENPEECVWVEGYRSICVLRKSRNVSETKNLSEFDKKQNWNKKRRKQCREIQKEMDARRRQFIIRIANHEVMPAPENHERNIINMLLAIALDGSAWLSKDGLIEYHTGKERWNMSEEERKAEQDALAAVHIIPKLMMAVDRYFHMRTGTDVECLIDYNGQVNKERIGLLNHFYGLLEGEYGYMKNDAEKAILQQKHEVFKTYEEAKEEGKA